MDGDVADLPALRSITDEYEAKLIVDAAHDMGVLDLTAGIRADLVTGSLSKSFASAGGVLAGPAEYVRYLRSNARSILFSIAMPPASAAAALAALDIIATEPERRARCLDLAAGLHDGLRALGFDTRPSTTPIVPVRFPDMATAGAFWAALFAAGVYTNLAGPPAAAHPMLRLTLTANHDDTHLARVLTAFDEAAHRLGTARDPALPAVALTLPHG